MMDYSILTHTSDIQEIYY